MFFPGMFDPNMLFLARLAQMNGLLSQAMLQALRNQELQDQPPQNQVFRNVAVPNVAPPPGFEFVPVGTCEDQLAMANAIFQGLVNTLTMVEPHLLDCISFVFDRLDEPGARDVQDALIGARDAIDNARDVLFPPSAPTIAMGPIPSCEDMLAGRRQTITALVNLITGPIGDALSLCSFFLAPRTDEAGAQDLLNGIRLFTMTFNRTILVAAMRFLQST